MGHSSITVTYDTYGHLFPERDVEITDALDGLFQRGVDFCGLARPRREPRRPPHSLSPAFLIGVKGSVVTERGRDDPAG